MLTKAIWLLSLIKIVNIESNCYKLLSSSPSKSPYGQLPCWDKVYTAGLSICGHSGLCLRLNMLKFDYESHDNIWSVQIISLCRHQRPYASTSNLSPRYLKAWNTISVIPIPSYHKYNLLFLSTASWNLMHLSSVILWGLATVVKTSFIQWLSMMV